MLQALLSRTSNGNLKGEKKEKLISPEFHKCEDKKLNVAAWLEATVLVMGKGMFEQGNIKTTAQ